MAIDTSKEAHKIIRTALNSGLVVILHSASIRILSYVAVNRAKDIIEDEIDIFPAGHVKEHITHSAYAIELLKIITNEQKFT